MITFFTDPYDGELITHAIARYIEYDRSSPSRVMLEIFSTLSVTVSLSFGNRIKDLSDALGGVYNVEYLINNFTILPYYKLFCPKNKYMKLYKYVMIGANNEQKRSTALIHVSKYLKSSVVYCGECVKEDLDKYGEIYLHREHYLWGANICYKHGIPLIEDELPDNGFKVSLGKLNLIKKVYGEEALGIYRDTLSNSNRQAALAVEILKANLDIYREEITEVYLIRLKCLGVIVKNNIDYAKIGEIIIDTYGEIGLTILKPYIDPKNITMHLFLNTKNFIDPSIHLLFIMALWRDNKLFINDCIKYNSKQDNLLEEDIKISKKDSSPVKRYRPIDISSLVINDCAIDIVGAAHRYKSIIEDKMIGPWICKDVYCKNNIKISTVSYDTSKKVLRQEIYCDCGCHYIVSMEVGVAEAEKKIKILDYSAQTKRTILEQYALGLGCTTIGNNLGISVRYIKRYIEGENITQHVAPQYKMLEIEVPMSEEEIVNYFWKEYWDFIFDFPHTQQSVFMKLLWDECKSKGSIRDSLYEVILSRHKRLISISKSRIKEKRDKKESLAQILKNVESVRAVSYLRLYANEGLEEMIFASGRRAVTEEDVNQLIKVIEERRRKNIEVTRTSLRLEFPKVMDYFYKEYREKYNQILPNKKSWGNELGVNKNEKRRKDINQSKEDKDAEYELLIRGISQQLLKRDSPIRITKTLLSKKIGDSKIKKLDEKRYPRAVATLNEFCESCLEYRYRVCKRVADKIEVQGEYVSLKQIFKLANIKDPEIYNNPDLREAVGKYLEEKKKL